MEAPLENQAAGRSPAEATCSKQRSTLQPQGHVVQPLRSTGLPNEDGNQQYHYWPFTTSALYNWCLQNAPFFENPCDLTNHLETVLFTHQPTWDNNQQLLQVLFTTDERNRIIIEACKVVPRPTGENTADSAFIDAGFPTVWPEWGS